MLKRPSIFKHFLCTLATLTFYSSGSLAAAASATKPETLWDNWYTEADDGTPHSYYNEKVETMGDRVKIQVNRWILDGKQTRLESEGASAKNTTLLEPLFYNFRTTENGVEKSIDGTVLNNGKVFSIKIARGGKDANTLRAEMVPKLILASFFPVWIHKNYKRISGVQPIEFLALLEDQVQDLGEKQVPVLKGTAYEMNPDDYSKQTHTRKLRIEFGKIVWFWYVTSKGDAVRITIPTVKKEIVKVSKEKAIDFLK